MTCRRWFHANISGEEAESLLLRRGTDGSFLCRPSGSNKNNYTLSVSRRGQVTHIQIQNHGTYYDLCAGEKFHSLSELITYYMENGLREKNGDIIELKYPIYSKEPTKERWFHGNLSAKEAEKLLEEKGKNGSFLVRESSRRVGDFVLTIRCDSGFTHVMIRHIDGRLDVGGGILFDTLTELVEHYRQNPMVEKNGGTVVHLKQPLNATKVIASSIRDRVDTLQKYVNTIADGKDGFSEEFEHLQQQERKHLYTRNAAKKNKEKNRFKNIGPFDHSRVILSDDPTQDYINASFIEGYKPNEYIATQGCLPETVVDFLRMLYQEKCTVVLMMSKEMERGKCRCARYWPNYKETLTIGHFTVENTMELDTPEFVSRELLLKNTNKPEESLMFKQYQYLAWPEHGSPSNVGSILGILHDIDLKRKRQKDAGPMVVHCGSGIGRTGAIIVVDILIKILQREGFDCEIDIQKTVQSVRDQRPGMVQLEAQYKFIYLAIAHYVEMETEFRSLPSQRSVGSERSDEVIDNFIKTPPPKIFPKRPPTIPTHNLPPKLLTHNLPPTLPTQNLPQRSIPPKPKSSSNGETPPPVPERKPGAIGGGLPEGVLVGTPIPQEELPPGTPPPIPPRIK